MSLPQPRPKRSADAADVVLLDLLAGELTAQRLRPLVRHYGRRNRSIAIVFLDAVPTTEFSGAFAKVATILTLPGYFLHNKDQEIELYDATTRELSAAFADIRANSEHGEALVRLAANLMLRTCISATLAGNLVRHLERNGHDLVLLVSKYDQSGLIYTGLCNRRAQMRRFMGLGLRAWLKQALQTLHSALMSQPRAYAFIHYLYRLVVMRRGPKRAFGNARSLVLVGGEVRKNYLSFLDQLRALLDRSELHEPVLAVKADELMAHPTRDATLDEVGELAKPREVLAWIDRFAALDLRTDAKNGARATIAALLSNRSFLVYPLSRIFERARRIETLLETTGAGSIFVMPVYSYLSSAAAFAGNRHRVPVLTCAVHSVAPHARSIPLAWPVDGILSYGTQMTECLTARGYPSERIREIGNPAFDVLCELAASTDERNRFRKRFGVAEDEHFIYVATSAFDPNEVLWMQELEKGARQQGWRIGLHPHPSVASDPVWRELAGAADRSAAQLVESDAHWAAFVASDLVITDFSTVGIEATVAGRPLVVVNLTGRKFPSNDYAAHDLGPEVTEIDQLVSACHSVLASEPSVERAAARERFSALYNHSNDGQATLRLVQCLQDPAAWGSAPI